MPQLAKEVSRAVEDKMKNNNIRFVKHIDPSAGRIRTDPGALVSALINFLENAVDACTEKKGEEEKVVRFSVQKEKNKILFIVEDNGIGMNQETKESIFTLFFSSKGTKGTGLGLYISHQVIKQLSGTIEVETAPGKGSRFLVRLPVN